MRKPYLQMFLTIALVAGVVVLYGCGGGSQAADQPASAEELKTRILEWVEEAPSKVDLQVENQNSDMRLRHYGANGLPVLLQIESDQPFPGPILYDGSSYYFQSTVDRDGLEAGQWVEIPQQMLETPEERRGLGDLVDTLAWFWIFDPLTLLRASTPIVVGQPTETEGLWTYRAEVTEEGLRDSVPNGLEEEDEFRFADGWEVEVTSEIDGEIREFTLHAQLDNTISYTAPWRRVEAAPEAPVEAVDIEEIGAAPDTPPPPPQREDDSLTIEEAAAVADFPLYWVGPASGPLLFKFAEVLAETESFPDGIGVYYGLEDPEPGPGSLDHLSLYQRPVRPEGPFIPPTYDARETRTVKGWEATLYTGSSGWPRLLAETEGTYVWLSNQEKETEPLFEYAEQLERVP